MEVTETTPEGLMEAGNDARHGDTCQPSQHLGDRRKVILNPTEFQACLGCV